MMRRFSLGLRNGSDAHGKDRGLLFEQAASLATVQELRPLFERELRRARRYERPLTILIIALESPLLSGVSGAARNGADGGNGAGGSLAKGNAYNGNGSAYNSASTGAHAGDPNDLHELYFTQLRFVHLGALLRDTLRESDLVGFAAETQDFVLVLPEANLASAEQLAQRIHRQLVSRTGAGIRAGSAVYPATGLTLAALVDHGRAAAVPLQPATVVERDRSHA